jgi:glycine C-acetyltransferase
LQSVLSELFPRCTTVTGIISIQISEIKEAGLYKNERVIVSPQGAEITLNTGQKVLNFCANNYLGLSANKKLVEAAKEALDTHGYGMSSVRFICGTGRPA